jgi:hypothetical protein
MYSNRTLGNNFNYMRSKVGIMKSMGGKLGISESRRGNLGILKIVRGKVVISVIPGVS